MTSFDVDDIQISKEPFLWRPQDTPGRRFAGAARRALADHHKTRLKSRNNACVVYSITINLVPNHHRQTCA
ncbi:hypothetical protein MJ575_24840 [Klebsiella pneumoniae]|nr:hypothetical protein MJ575_24840 [Klebsiella pneumoniae]